MVERSRSRDAVFRALADATRRGLLEGLAAGERTVGELAARFPVSFQAVSKHLKLLEGAGLVARTRQGRTQRIRLVPRRLLVAERWAAGVRAFWEGRLDALEAHLEADGRRAKRRSPDG
jgi:DNA-binding transcriptional ArsR family regulator